VRIYFKLPVFAFVVSASDFPVYHNGWIDLNKNGKKDVYEDPSQPVPKRVADLLARMTLEEKIGQLQQLDRSTNAATYFGDQLRVGAVGSFLGGSELVETPVQRTPYSTSP